MTPPGRALAARGLLADFCEADVLHSADVHVANRLGALAGEQREDVLLAVALAVRAVRLGSVCLHLSTARESTGVEDPDDETLDRLARLRWPDPDDWRAAVAGSALVAAETASGVPAVAHPLRLVGDRLYLDRYWRQESLIAAVIDERRARRPVALDEERLAEAVHRLFPGRAADLQRLAAVVAAHRWVSVLAGGPGTGKTTTVAKLLAVLRDQPGEPPRVALAAPTGKAAARLEEAVRLSVAGFGPEDRERVGDLSATTVHRLLGWRPGARNRFHHDRDNRLPYDLIVVDEASMVPLTLMARLVEALPDSCRLVLVGDPDQLASVEAGAVLGDLVRRRAPVTTSEIDVGRYCGAELSEVDEGVARRAVVTLTRVHRTDQATTDITELARRINDRDADGVLDLLTRGAGLELVAPDDWDGVRSDVVDSGTAVSGHALRGDGAAALSALDRHRVLCAHRRGPYGVSRWSRLVEEWLREEMPGYGSGGLWYVGRPLLVNGNDPSLQLYNGDTGVVVRRDGTFGAVFAKGAELRWVATNRLSEVSTLHAMSVHKSQGSEFARVTVVLPEPASPLLTKELFYTAVTRARQHVRVIGTPESVRAAVTRRIQRASGLGEGGPHGADATEA